MGRGDWGSSHCCDERRDGEERKCGGLKVLHRVEMFSAILNVYFVRNYLLEKNKSVRKINMK